jgi:hypothetical protein
MPIAVLAPLDRLKMYTPNKQTSAVTPSPPAVVFDPFVPQRISRKGRKSTVSARQKEKSKSVPTDLLTCVEVRTIEDATVTSNRITICTGCACFQLEKFDNPWLRSFNHNSPSTIGLARRYRCRTLWQPPSSPSSLTMSSSPVDASNDPCILSHCHSSLSPRPNRKKGNYSKYQDEVGEENTTPTSQNKKKKQHNKKPKQSKQPTLSTTPTSCFPGSTESSISPVAAVQKHKRKKLEELCQ